MQRLRLTWSACARVYIKSHVHGGIILKLSHRVDVCVLHPLSTLHAHRLIHEFEREARTDGMPARELADRKRRLANQLNAFIARKKAASGTEEGRNELLAGAAAPMQQPPGGAGPQGQAGAAMSHPESVKS
jgi:hypothetical protein